MTDEQIVKGLRCWAGKIVKDEECAKCAFGEDCSLGEIVDAAENRINELAAENAALRERIDKAVEVLEKLKEEIEPRVYKSFFGFVVQVRTLQEHKEIYGTEEDALARLAELKGGEHE